ncbi:(Fe-S)-binding protein [Methanocella sp. CWC-04]|uniref:(Fe-S)-binding protein n=1 Tax=Methanooceanicella nereidis TaxID=2052831 RepID=A0AAP2RAZ4_9EURY|nr:hypothetical protein [Methanocella sp. CWC-04]MCD1294048.1 (Fe-S)-binding protein [Methanocella sp. CWC-04]
MKRAIESLIKGYVKDYPALKNTLTGWDEPLVAYADVKDEMFIRLKEIISPTHAMPEDFLEGARTVITYFIPFEKSVAQSNIPGRESSRQWAVAYIETNQMINDLSIFIKGELEKMGYRSAVIPATHNFDGEKLISDWSHRHVAYVAGLGTFGLNNMLITDRGCCGRVGSMVTDLKIEPTERDGIERCLYKGKGICKKCVDRCVNQALRADSFDRHRCYEMCLYNDSLYSGLGLTDVCAKCMVGVPCSFKGPGNMP